MYPFVTSVVSLDYPLGAGIHACQYMHLSTRWMDSPPLPSLLSGRQERGHLPAEAASGHCFLPAGHKHGDLHQHGAGKLARAMH